MPKTLYLADDDDDDCFFFREAVTALPENVRLTTVNDGEQLMKMLHGNKVLPDILFLDLNMPRKNGFQCLSEIKTDKRLKILPVIIYSTSFQKEVIAKLHESGADFYVRKPNDFARLQKVLMQVLTAIEKKDFQQPTKEFFLLYA